MSNLYRKKPVIITAIQFDLKNVDTRGSDYCWKYGLEYDKKADLFYIQTLEGKMYVSDKDYIIKGIKGERYACRPDIFELTYEKIENE